MDLFSAQLRGFNFEGRRKVHTHLGLMMSAILVTLMVGFLATKMIKLVRGKEDSLMIMDKANQHNTSARAIDFNDPKVKF